MTPIQRVVHYYSKYKSQFIVGLAFAVPAFMLNAIHPYIVREFINIGQNFIDAGKGDSPEFRKLVWTCGLSIPAIYALYWIFAYRMRRNIIIASRCVGRDMREDLFRHLCCMSQSFYHRMKTGDLMSRVAADVEAVRQIYGPVTLHFTGIVLRFVTITAFMVMLDPVLAISVLFPAAGTLVTYQLIRRKLHRMAEEVQKSAAEVSSHCQESFAGGRVVKSFNRQAYQEKSFEKICGDNRDKTLKLTLVQTASRVLIQVMSGVFILLVLWIGGRRVMEGHIRLGDLVAFVMYQFQLVWPLMALGWILGLAQHGMAAMGRVNEILQTKPEIAEVDGAYPIQTEIAGRISNPVVEFRNLNFRYSEKGPWVLRNIDLKIRAGERIAIIGRTGSGKTTLASLIVRLFDAAPGMVWIGDRDIRDIPIPELRRSIGYVPQDSFLFSDTLAANIALGLSDEPPKNDIESYAELVSLTSDIQNFRNGLDEIVGERGVTLSGGQKQRSALARALIKRPDILILDDSFSAVDTQTEEAILQNLRLLGKDCTLIVISHRISTVKEADRILVMDDGRIVEEGPHEALVEKNGIYAEINRNQLLSSEIENLG